MLQPPEVGEVFRYLPNVRTGNAAKESAVSAVLDGDETGLIDLAPPAGTLVIFRGHGSLHCVAPVTGPHPRLVGVLSYAREPDQHMDATSQLLLHGRVT